MVEDEEACDGEDLAGASCETAGFDGGELRCGRSCSLDTSACHHVERCDNSRDDDGDGLIDCADPDCFGQPPCPRCGDGVINRDEACDGAELGGATCESIGYGEGELACTSVCSFDTTSCTRQEHCGNGVDDDGNGLADCEDPACVGVAPCPHCGDGLVNVPGEQCDGIAVDALCTDFGLDLGTVRCTAECTYDLTGCGYLEDCSVPGDEDEDGLADCADSDCLGSYFCPACGDGIVQQGETCDGDVVPACADLGFTVGTASCSERCAVDTNGCRDIVCGDGFVDPPERCDPAHPTEGVGCTSACYLIGDTCAAPGVPVWDADGGVWYWDSDTTRFFADYSVGCGQSTALPDAVAAFTATVTGRYHATVTGSLDAVLSLWEGGCGAAPALPACIDEQSGGERETLEFDLAAGEMVHLLIGGSTAASGPTAGAFRLEIGEVICGDGEVQGWEQCDDGNTVGGDACNSLCRLEGDSCADAYDLNVNGMPSVDWAPWFTRANDKWLWQGSTRPFNNTFSAGCRQGPSRDAVARFVAPATGRYDIRLISEFDVELYALDAACSAGIPPAQFWPIGCPPPLSPPGSGEVRVYRYHVDLAQGEVVHFVVDGAPTVDQYGSFWLYVDSRYSCGDGVVDASEFCDDGNDVPLDGCTACEPDETKFSPDRPVPGAGTILPEGVEFAAQMVWYSQAQPIPFNYVLQATAGVTYRIRTNRDRLAHVSLTPDTYIRLRDAVGGLVLAENDDRSATDPTSEVVWTAPVTGYYVVEVGPGPNRPSPVLFEGFSIHPGASAADDVMQFALKVDGLP